MPLVQSPMKRYYVPDPMSLQRTCEVNYMALMKLLPRRLRGRPSAAIRCRATAAVPAHRHRGEPLHQPGDPGPAQPELPSYLQASRRDSFVSRCANGGSARRNRFRCCNHVMIIPIKKCITGDEKEQVNLFLADWLRFCLKHGTSLINIL